MGPAAEKVRRGVEPETRWCEKLTVGRMPVPQRQTGRSSPTSLLVVVDCSNDLDYSMNFYTNIFIPVTSWKIKTVNKTANIVVKIQFKRICFQLCQCPVRNISLHFIDDTLVIGRTQHRSSCSVHCVFYAL